MLPWAHAGAAPEALTKDDVEDAGDEGVGHGPREESEEPVCGHKNKGHKGHEGHEEHKGHKGHKGHEGHQGHEGHKEHKGHKGRGHSQPESQPRVSGLRQRGAVAAARVTGPRVAGSAAPLWVAQRRPSAHLLRT